MQLENWKTEYFDIWSCMEDCFMRVNFCSRTKPRTRAPQTIHRLQVLHTYHYTHLFQYDKDPLCVKYEVANIDLHFSPFYQVQKFFVLKDSSPCTTIHCNLRNSFIFQTVFQYMYVFYSYMYHNKHFLRDTAFSRFSCI